MNRRSLRALIVLNAVLLAAVTVVSFSPSPAQAQFGNRANYLMIAGDTRTNPRQQTVYVMEVNTGRIASMMFNSKNEQLTVLGARDAGADFQKVRDRR